MSIQLSILHGQGFTESYQTGRKTVRVKCQNCEALVINGVACHETGCDMATYECKGCNEIIDYRGYCADCQ